MFHSINTCFPVHYHVLSKCKEAAKHIMKAQYSKIVRRSSSSPEHVSDSLRVELAHGGHKVDTCIHEIGNKKRTVVECRQ